MRRAFGGKQERAAPVEQPGQQHDSKKTEDEFERISPSKSERATLAQMVRWLFVSIALLGLSATLVLVGHSQNFDSVKPTLIAVNITVAVLAINFAFSAYQASEYRQFQRGLSLSVPSRVEDCEERVVCEGRKG